MEYKIEKVLLPQRIMYSWITKVDLNSTPTKVLLR